MSAADDVITRITEADSEEAAYTIMLSVPVRIVMQVADQLYVQTEGRGTNWIRRAVVREARA
jgi:hypothetical protein